MIRVRRFGIAALLVATTIVALSACGKPALGGKCTAGQGACVDEKSGLYCGTDGTYKAMTCGGDHGCKAQDGKPSCDNDIAAIGDGCDTPNDGACTSDHKKLLQCKNEKFVLIDTCKGPGACKIAGDQLNCDNDIADIGDPCSNKGNFACTADKGTALQCNEGKYGAVQSCRGPRACRIAHDDPKNRNKVDIDCDYTVANENDPCLYADAEACSSDKKTKFTCRGNKYTDATACGGPDGCTAKITSKSVRATCDVGGGTVTPEPKKGRRHHH